VEKGRKIGENREKRRKMGENWEKARESPVWPTAITKAK